MREFELRKDLERVVIQGFALPLGFAPVSGVRMEAPVQGYTVSYMAGEEDEPDTYSFHIVVSHERVRPILHKAFELLPAEVYGIIEIGSRDAYRSTDVYISEAEHPISREEFLAVWEEYEPFLLEDGSIAAGANSEEPFIEVFVDQWKGILIHAPLEMREQVEEMLQAFGLEEVPQTWKPEDGEEGAGGAGGAGVGGGSLSLRDEEEGEESPVRSVLDLSDDQSPDVDELLLNLRHDWRLELNIDRESNIDDGGRHLGTTLWHAVVIVDAANPNGDPPHNFSNDSPHNSPHASSHDSPYEKGAYASVWATAGSLGEMERLVDSAIVKQPDWVFGEIYTIDRVAYDERPDELADLKFSRRSPQVHLVTIEPWSEPARPDRKGDDSNRERDDA